MGPGGDVATILIVDDRPTNREFLVTLLGYKGHRLLEASDGAEALEVVKKEKPDLVIADILMPNMDGYEFVRLLRSTPDVADTTVIFNTAYYLEREAQNLAKACGVNHILTKPSAPETVLATVDAALGVSERAVTPSVPTGEFDREHLRLLTDKLSEKTDELRAANLRLTALIELNKQLASERNPLLLAERYCQEAREIIGAKYSAVGILADDGRTLRHLYASGLDPTAARRIVGTAPCSDALDSVVTTGNPFRLRGLDKAIQDADLRQGRLPISSVMGGPLAYATKVYGWLALLDKLGADEFDDEDEQLTATFASQLAVAYDNARLYTQARDHAAALEREALQREQAEEARRRLAAILEATTDFVGTCDLDGRILYINDAGLKIVGIDYMPGASHISALCPQWAYEVIRNEAIPAAIRYGAWTGETALLAPDGKAVPVSQVILAHRTPDGTVSFLSTIARDITEAKRSEEALRQAEEKYRSIFENASEGIFQSTASGQIVTANPAFAKILGYDSPDQLITASATEVTESGEAYRFDIHHFIELGDEVKGIETQLSNKDGKKIWASISGHAVRDSNGELLYYDGIAEDISERKQLEQELMQAQKMEAVGRLAGGVAHDFNNLLTAIIGYGQLALAGLDRVHPSYASIQEIIRAGERAASLTRQLLAFSRKQVLQPQLIELNSILSDLGNMLARLIGEDVDIRFVLDATLKKIKADPGQIEQVVLNLVVNARDAMPGGGKLTIETKNVYLDEKYTQWHLALSPGSYIMLAVTDTGCGMDAETRSHIFEPFFTTKEHGKGTGLGLSTVYGIVKQSGGDILVYSEAGRGTTFKIYLPALDDGMVGSEVRQHNDSVPTGSELILLVEDESMVRELASNILRGLGYDVLEASSGEDALIIALQQKGKIDLLLTDVVMPRMSGKELADRIQTSQSDIKVLFTSGYTDDAIVHLGVLERGTAFLQKPFTPSSLARKVRETLDE
jgi:PAS domain S-box-containing protein